MSTPNKDRKRRGTVTAKRFFDLVVLVIGEKTAFTANTAVPIAEVRAEVLRRADLTPEELLEFNEKQINRKIEFAFRNRRGKYRGGEERALTVQVGKYGQWGITELGVARARTLSGDPGLPPETGNDTKDISTTKRGRGRTLSAYLPILANPPVVPVECEDETETPCRGTPRETGTAPDRAHGQDRVLDDHPLVPVPDPGAPDGGELATGEGARTSEDS